MERSAFAPALPLLPVLSVLFETFGSGSSALAVALLLKMPGLSMVAVTVMVTLVSGAMLGMVQGKPAQAPLTPVTVRFDGVSFTCTLLAMDGPSFDTVMV